MDVDFLNSPTEAQMELMTMMMQMEKLTEFSEPIPPMDLSTASTQPFYDANIAPHYSPTLACSLSPSSSFAGTTSTHDSIVTPILPHPNVAAAANTQLLFGDRRASVAAMREMIFRIAAMQPVHIDPESVKPPKRRNVRISKDPQSVAARHRRERISERIRTLQRLVPGGTKMDTASMLDEAIHYVKFLKNQVQSLERATASRGAPGVGFSPAAPFAGGNYLCFGKVYEPLDQGFINSGQMLI